MNLYVRKDHFMSIIIEKKELRENIRQIKALMTQEEIETSDKLIEQKLMMLNEITDAKTIFCFVSMEDEINTKEIIKKLLSMGKIVGVPKCESKNNMKVYKIESLEDLEKGYYNIEEPKSYCEIIKPEDIELAIIPATACDKNKNRIGKGAGYYDRYLKDQNFLKVVLCREKCLVDKVPTEGNDVAMDIVVTEKNIY